MIALETMDPEVFARLVPLGDAAGEPFGDGSPCDPVAALSHWAAVQPDKPAIVTAAGTVTFGGLDALSRSLALRLRRELGARGRPVVACGPIGPLPFATQAACLRLGLPMVPLDPDRSALRNRQAVMLAQAGVAVCAGAPETAAPHIGPGVPIVELDGLVAADGEPGDLGAPDAPALVIFTSGSTGVPKGVVKSRRSMAEAFRIRRHMLGTSAADVCGFAGSSSVSGSHLNCWTALVSGATLVVAGAGDGVGDVLDGYAAHGVTVSTFYVGFGRVVAQHPAARAKLATLRLVTLFGDVVQWSDIARLREALPAEAEIFCSFGATEASYSLGFAVPRGPLPATGGVPIGRCLPGATIWLDPAGSDGAAPVPGSGELLVASPRLSSSYWRDDARTRERFFRHPDGSGRVIFRTGDMVSLDADGLVAFLGREDNQVKLRGWRIELEEIETVARKAPGVGAACVVPRRDAAGAVQSLVLYVDGAVDTPRAADVAAVLRRELASQMWPAEVVVARRLPTSQSAKVDRIRLAEVDRQRRERAASLAVGNADAGDEWSDPLERRLAATLAQELVLPRLERTRSFIDSGGDSLRALSCALAIERTFGVSPDPESFLDDLSLADLVATLAGEVRRANRELVDAG